MKAPDKVYVNIPGDYWHPGTDEKVNTDTEYIRKDVLVDKLYKWLDKDTTVTYYYSKKDFKKVIDSLF